MMILTKQGCLLIVLALVGLTLGCSDSGLVIARGNLLNDGSPLEVNKGEFINMAFLPYADGAPSALYRAGVRTDGSFEVRGDTDEGIPPGKYRVMVMIRRGILGPDKLGGKFGQLNSPIVREVNGEDEITVDIGQPN